RLRPPPRPTLFPYTTLFRSHDATCRFRHGRGAGRRRARDREEGGRGGRRGVDGRRVRGRREDGGGDLAAPVPPAGPHAGEGSEPAGRVRASVSGPRRCATCARPRAPLAPARPCSSLPLSPLIP